MLVRNGNALPTPAQKQRHQQVEFLIAVRRKREGGQTGLLHIYRQFLRQFADQRLLRRLSSLDLAARKFP